jgi:hypothetical protein
MTIGFAKYTNLKGGVTYRMFVKYREDNEGSDSQAMAYDVIESTRRAIDAIDSTGNSHFGFPPDKLPVVVAALRLAGFEVK